YLKSSVVTTGLGTEYMFRIRVKNPTEANNAITAGELEVRYFIDNTLIALRLSSSEALGTVSIPVDIAAGGSIEGDVRFFAAADLLKDRTPQDFVVVFTDTFDNKSTIPVEIIHERAASK
ncbi:MAG TPA: hypothetical protein VF277_02505, partial [Steroidobacteraceae bacterium]